MFCENEKEYCHGLQGSVQLRVMLVKNIRYHYSENMSGDYVHGVASVNDRDSYVAHALIRIIVFLKRCRFPTFDRNAQRTQRGIFHRFYFPKSTLLRRFTCIVRTRLSCLKFTSPHMISFPCKFVDSSA